MVKTGRMGHAPDSGRDSGRAARQRADRRGRAAEFIALVYLVLTCHRILARRWRGPAGEIDLVARRGRRIIFVEVKYRQNTGNGAVPTAVQRRRIERAAVQFHQQRRISRDFEWRFDLIQISPFFGGILYGIRHLRDAWRTSAE